jgi:arylsulfatase
MVHVTDIMRTLVEVTGAKHPETYEGHSIQPLEGRSLVPVFQGQTRDRNTPIFWEHEGNRAVRLGPWKLVARRGQDWELYDTEVDRTEIHNLAASRLEKVSEMSALYDAWAKRCGVVSSEQLPSSRRTPPPKSVPETKPTGRASGS